MGTRRKLILKAGVVVSMGVYAITTPPAAIAEATFAGCFICIHQGSCTTPEAYYGQCLSACGDQIIPTCNMQVPFCDPPLGLYTKIWCIQDET